MSKDVKNLKIYNVLRNNALGFVAGGIIAGSVTAIGANYYNANSFKYDNEKDDSQTVSDALNKLYSIAEDNTGLIYLGEGTSFDVSNISGYNNFTIDNFIIGTKTMSATSACSTSIPYYDWGQGWVGVSGTCQRSVSSTVITPDYDSTTGTLTITATNCTPFVYLITQK